MPEALYVRRWGYVVRIQKKFAVTTDELNKDLYWYIEVYYKRIRKHSANSITSSNKWLNRLSISLRQDQGFPCLL